MVDETVERKYEDVTYSADTHAVYGDVEDGADVGSRINTSMRGDVLGKLLDGHDIGVL